MLVLPEFVVQDILFISWLISLFVDVFVVVFVVSVFLAPQEANIAIASIETRYFIFFKLILKFLLTDFTNF